MRLFFSGVFLFLSLLFMLSSVFGADPQGFPKEVIAEARRFLIKMSVLTFIFGYLLFLVR